MALTLAEGGVSPTLAHRAYVLKQHLDVGLHTVGQRLKIDVGLRPAQKVRLPGQWPGSGL